MTRIAVLGAGANGASIGADLTAAGLDVTLIEQWPAHAELLRAQGARITTGDRVTVQPVTVIDVCQVAELRDGFDVVFMLMKAYDTRWAAELIKPRLADDGILVGLQNGMTADTISEIVGAHRTLGCVIEVLSMMFEPGVIERTSSPEESWFALGSIDSSTKGREEEIAALLRHSGTVELVEDIRSTKWMKLVSNATTMATTSMLGLPALAALEQPGMRELAIRSGQEALDAGRAQGFSVLPIFGLTEADVADYDTVVEALFEALITKFVTPTTRSTILMDWSKGRRSETADINGRVVEVAEEHGLDVPVNRAVVEIARRIERGELRPRLENLELLKRLAG